jgi:2,3-bisphosphoglycerate-independent phosphoglycerate mutase
MINSDGSPNTAHTTNPVPIILIDKDHQQINDGRLADIAPTILALLSIPAPAEMDGKVLL